MQKNPRQQKEHYTWATSFRWDYMGLKELYTRYLCDGAYLRAVVSFKQL